ncbi:Phytoene dehydrogenase-related protein [Methanococcoides vulcani]|uniref:Phytoene dehydrogenase-related protein n=1 Tax=Methanococcoides vulcani TaxID=1353158 RepID=A0A1H9YA47_9EURY|nr:NAD(P)/FAD-dependent oxidoreductase [Methanococcoides vulcani]SES65672.1 Phytoene dehydrogenase-related protein [Methanococcoides vulcani]
MKVIVIGAGLGGLLSAAKLSGSGYEVEVFERLPMTGGRFTNIDIKGYQLTTGALHMIPHGPTGPLAQLLEEVGADVIIERDEGMAFMRIFEDIENNIYEDVPFGKFGKTFSLWNRIKLALFMITTRKNPPKDCSFAEWLSRNFDTPLAYQMADSFCGWALSLKAADVPAEEVFEIFENLYRYGGPGVPIGGCKAVTDALADVVRSNGGTMYTDKEVSEIIIKDGKASGVIIDGQKYPADLVISNIGHNFTHDLCKDVDISEEHQQYLDRIKVTKPSAGVKICLAANEPLIGHGGVLFTPSARLVNGINEVTNIDPDLAPQGKHLVMAHQTTQWERTPYLEDEIDLGIKDLEEIFAGKDFEVLLTQSYYNGWPVNRSSSGSDIGNTTPIEGLYVVGDGAKGKGGIEVEGVALGVRNTMKLILDN